VPLQLLCQRLSLNQKISKATECDVTVEPVETREVLEEEIIRLLGERLLLTVASVKLEVIVRKEIETRMIQVPVRREVIVEQVSPERKQLAEINLGKKKLLELI